MDIDFWFEFGSTYSYPAAMRVEALAQAQLPESKAKLRAQTDEAVRLGILGAPTVVVGEELFWGNDRLEDAPGWAASRCG